MGSTRAIRPPVTNALPGSKFRAPFACWTNSPEFGLCGVDTLHTSPESSQVHPGRGSIELVHSHLLVQHLLKQVELWSADKPDRDIRPAWLLRLIERLGQMFEPLSDVARAGCACEWTEMGWEVRLFLGPTEIVGGPLDGCSRSMGFDFDLLVLQDCLDVLEDFRWSVATTDGESGGSSFLELRGWVSENPVCIKVYSRPPREARPALRMRSDGTVEEA